MPQLHETIYGKRLLESDVPRGVKALETIAEELKKLNEENVGKATTYIDEKAPTWREVLQQIANEISPFEPALARLLRQYVK